MLKKFIVFALYDTNHYYNHIYYFIFGDKLDCWSTFSLFRHLEPKTRNTTNTICGPLLYSEALLILNTSDVISVIDSTIPLYKFSTCFLALAPHEFQYSGPITQQIVYLYIYFIICCFIIHLCVVQNCIYKLVYSAAGYEHTCDHFDFLWEECFHFIKCTDCLLLKKILGVTICDKTCIWMISTVSWMLLSC